MPGRHAAPETVTSRIGDALEAARAAATRLTDRLRTPGPDTAAAKADFPNAEGFDADA